MNKTTKTFSFDTPINLELESMLGVPSLEVHIIVFNMAKVNNLSKV